MPVFDATVAARCKAAGLPMLGKTNTDEFAMGSSTENSAYGPTRNPWDPTRVPGGSGGGSAAAVAAGLAPWALGSDTGGSVKLPGGVLRQRRPAPDLRHRLALRDRRVRLEPRPGRPGDAERPRQRAPLRDHQRPRRERLDHGRRPAGRAARGAATSKGSASGCPRQLNEVEGIEPGVKAAVDAAIAQAAALGAEIEECELPLSVDYGLPCYYLIAPAEASANLARYDGVRYGLRSDGADFREMVMSTRHDGLRRRAEAADHARHLRALVRLLRRLLRDRAEGAHGDQARARAAFERFDVLVSPTCATTAFPIGAKAADPLAMYLTDVLTIPSNMAGLPGLSIPCGLSDGLPVGLQLIGPQFSENTLYRVAARARGAIGFDAVPERLDRVTAWEPVIGLEIHVQLKTRTKMFCRCANGFGGGPNTQTCPVCLAFPGALPVPNRRRSSRRSSSGSRSAARSPTRAVFHRKNYFYPDNPKAYQISQYDEPLCAGGKLVVPTADGDIEVGIVRAHLEEDAAKNVHVAASGRIHGATATLVDFNRCGTPLLEIVTEPDIHSADDAKRFLQLLRQTVVELGLSDAELEKGSMRFDVNVSVRPAGSDELRTRTELKNMNSFNFAAKGIEREIARQIEDLRGRRHRRAGDAALRPRQRGLAAAALQGRGAGLPLLPRARSRAGRAAGRARRAACAPRSASCRATASSGSPRRSRSTTPTCSSRAASTGSGRTSSTRAPTRRRRRTCSRTPSSPPGVDPERVDAGGAREARRRRAPRSRARRSTRRSPTPGDEGFSAEPYLAQKAVSDVGELDPIIDAVIAANPGQAEQFRGGKEGLLGFFVGQVMKETGGKADPRVVSERVRAKLNA